MFHGPWMHHRKRARFFEKGALKFLILDIIAAKPRHGYEVIGELEERSGGFYSPSPGAVYPTLQMLEDIGQLRVKEDNGKKVYELTDEGTAYLSEHKEKIKQHRERMSECYDPAVAQGANLMFELKSVFHHAADSARRSRGDAKKIEAIRGVLQRTQKEIDKIIGA